MFETIQKSPLNWYDNVDKQKNEKDTGDLLSKAFSQLVRKPTIIGERNKSVDVSLYRNLKINDNNNGFMTKLMDPKNVRSMQTLHLNDSRQNIYINTITPTAEENQEKDPN